LLKESSRRREAASLCDVESKLLAKHDLINQTTTMSTLKATILIISTTASRDPSADSSGRILKDVFEQEGGGRWEVVETKIVGDEVLDIQRSIMNWADREDQINLIVSTGGTGFAIHDSTPEVSTALHIIGNDAHGSEGCHSSLA